MMHWSHPCHDRVAVDTRRIPFHCLSTHSRCIESTEYIYGSHRDGVARAAGSRQSFPAFFRRSFHHRFIGSFSQRRTAESLRRLRSSLRLSVPYHHSHHADDAPPDKACLNIELHCGILHECGCELLALVSSRNRPSTFWPMMN